jgi:hypothetical protein
MAAAAWNFHKKATVPASQGQSNWPLHKKDLDPCGQLQVSSSAEAQRPSHPCSGPSVSYLVLRTDRDWQHLESCMLEVFFCS